MEGNNNKSVETLGSKSSIPSSSNHVDNVVEMHEKIEQNDIKYKSTPPLASTNHKLPVLFERSRFGFFNPSFDSNQLEAHLDQSFFPQTQARFRLALFYIIVASVCWMVYFGVAKPGPFWIAHIGGCGALVVAGIILVMISTSSLYPQHYYVFSAAFLVLLAILTLLQYIPDEEQAAMSRVSSFCTAVAVIMLTYHYLPLPLFGATGLALAYSIIYQTLTMWRTEELTGGHIVATILLHLCVHIVCISVYLVFCIRRHSLFWEIGQATMARRRLKEEKRLKEDMIHSLMPPNVAKEAMQHRNADDDERPNGDGNQGPSAAKGELVFRQFTMDRMENVSILFADIVGFTKMSSNKTAETLVKLLNDLFARFDNLCTKNGCEKISTLGDCYYCVSGCPNPDENHADNCIRLGLDMVEAIKAFDAEHNEEVNMRVGVHTGTVLCGIVGTRRFKFDVWSHDVDLANVMESTGQPGRVHLSEATYKFVKDLYEVEPGEEVNDTRIVRNLTEQYIHATSSFGVQQIESKGVTATYFIVKVKDGCPLGGHTADDCVAANSSPSPPKSVETPVNTTHPSDSEPVTSSKEEERIDLIVDDKNNNTRHLTGIANKNSVHPAQCLEDDDELIDDNKANSAFFSSRTKSEEELNNYGINDRRKGSKAIKRMDALLLEEMSADMEMNRNFRHVPVNHCTLNFKEVKDEDKYRTHTADDFLNTLLPKTHASPRYNLFVDIIISFVYTILLAISMAVGYQISARDHLAWIIITLVCCSLMILQLVAVSFAVFSSPSTADLEASQASFCGRFHNKLYGWIPNHVIGLVQLLIPLAVVFTAYHCPSLMSHDGIRELYFLCAAVTAILHSINLTLISSWMKSVIAIFGGLLLLIVYYIPVCPGSDSLASQHLRSYDFIVALILLLVLIVALNRDVELMTRLAYNGTLEAERNRRKAEKEKHLADWLLHDIIPSHVMEQIRLKQTKGYSQSHKDVGVVFISIVNFDAFYDESFQGGKEFLRVLNELFMDYEALFDKDIYKDIEKIKTIGSTFMAASGLNQSSRDKNAHPHEHLHALMDFCLDILETVRAFNKGMFNFEFELKIGFNVGNIVSGVIGTSKLHYDIWGNTVNVSSRMYSTGVAGRIQVTEETAQLLEDEYEFEYRDTIFVKGKGMMKTYLLVKKRDEGVASADVF